MALAANTSNATVPLLTTDTPPLDVVAAVLHDDAGHVLVTQRPIGKPLAGFWEFPGGKLEAGESQVQCLVRELHEELGIEVLPRDCTPLMQLEHCYPERLVRLHVWNIAQHTGSPTGREGQALRWLAPTELGSVQLLPADEPIVKYLLDGAGADTMKA